MEKTVLEYLQELPDGYRERAINNTKRDSLSFLGAEKSEEFLASPGGSLGKVVTSSFVWITSPEGDEFWSQVNDWVDGKGKLPPLPTEEGASV